MDEIGSRNEIDPLPRIFDQIGMFDNPIHRHGNSDQLSPLNYEKQYLERLASL